MKMDQIAYYCDSVEAELQVKKSLGLMEKNWIKDIVTARSRVWFNKEEGINKAMLQFNYDLGIELEIIRYIEGDHWHNPFYHLEPFISHIGIHLDDGEEFPEMAGCRLAQETFTINHTAKYLNIGPAAGRKYHYRIFEFGPGNYIKYIRRIHPT